MGYIQFSKIVKQQADQEDVRALLLKNYEFLKDTFLTLVINTGNFPYLTKQRFAAFCGECQLVDSVMS